MADTRLWVLLIEKLVFMLLTTQLSYLILTKDTLLLLMEFTIAAMDLNLVMIFLQFMVVNSTEIIVDSALLVKINTTILKEIQRVNLLSQERRRNSLARG